MERIDSLQLVRSRIALTSSFLKQYEDSYLDRGGLDASSLVAAS